MRKRDFLILKIKRRGTPLYLIFENYTTKKYYSFSEIGFILPLKFSFQ